MIQLTVTHVAMKSLLKDLRDNNVTFALASRCMVFIDDTPKGRLSVKLVKERFGIRNIKTII